MTKYIIMTTYGEVSFIGQYRWDLKTDNRHYYQKEDGTILTFQKEHMVCVTAFPQNQLKQTNLKK